MAINIKPEKEKTFNLPGSFDVLFYYSIILLLFCLSGYLLISQWNIELQSQIENRRELLDRLGREADFNKNQDLVYEYMAKISDYTYLVWNRAKVDDFFLFLENATHPMSRLESTGINLTTGSITMVGETLNFRTLEQQHSILKNFSMEREIFGWIDKSQIIEKRINWNNEGGLEYRFEVAYPREYDHFDWVAFDMSGRLLKRSLGGEDGENENFKISFSEDYRGEVVGIRVTSNNDEESRSKEFIFGIPDEGNELTLLREIYPDNSVIVKNAINLRKSPISGEDPKRIDFEGEKALPLLSHARKEDYVFQKGMRGHQLLDQDWFEVAGKEKIHPIEEVVLSGIREIEGEDLGVSFQFNITFDPLIFK